MLAALEFLKPEWWFDKAGAAALPVVTAIIFAESGLLFGFFLPGDSLLFFTGFLTSSAAREDPTFSQFAEHIPSIWVVLICLAAAAIIGDQVGYWFGKKVGPCAVQPAELPAVQGGERGQGARVLRAPRRQVDRARPLRADHPHVHADRRRRRRDAVPDVRHVQRHRCACCGPSASTTLGHFLGEIEFFRKNIEVAIIAVIVLSLVPVAVEVYRSRKHQKAASDALAGRRSRAAVTASQAGSAGQPLLDDGDDVAVLAPEVVASALDPVVGDRAGDRRRPLLQLVRRAERIAGRRGRTGTAR